MNNHLETTSIPIAWFTVLASAERKTPRGDLQAIEKWQEQGTKIDHKTVIGPAFWQAHEPPGRCDRAKDRYLNMG